MHAALDLPRSAAGLQTSIGTTAFTISQYNSLEPTPLADRKITMHGLRVARSLFLLSVPLYAWITEKNAPVSKFLNPRLRNAIYLVGVLLVLTIFRIRSRELNRAKDQLSKVAVDPAAARRWRAIQLLLLGCSEAVALYGLVIRFLGGTFAQACPLYITGFLLLLYFVPRELSEMMQEH